MPVTCPHCSTRYVLPKALLGPGGARVRCPRCREPFAVSPEGEAIAPAAKPAGNGAAPAAPENGTPAHDPVPAGPPRLEVQVPEPEAAPAGPVHATIVEDAPAMVAAGAAPAAPVETPLTVARNVLDELAKHSEGAITASRDAGSLFREFGPVIAEAFEFYRRQVGPGADAAPFRAALREKWGVDLDPGQPTGRLS